MAVVFEAYHDAITVTLEAEQQSRGGRFAGGRASLGRLHAVVQRVAHHVQQWIQQFVEGRSIELEVTALDGEMHALAQFLGQLVDRLFQPLDHDTKRHQAQLANPGVVHSLLI